MRLRKWERLERRLVAVTLLVKAVHALLEMILWYAREILDALKDIL